MGLSNKQKIEVAQIYHLKSIGKRLEEALDALRKAQDDWCILNSADGDKTAVTKAPILRVTDAVVTLEIAQNTLQTLEDMLNH